MTEEDTKAVIGCSCLLITGFMLLLTVGLVIGIML